MDELYDDFEQILDSSTGSFPSVEDAVRGYERAHVATLRQHWKRCNESLLEFTASRIPGSSNSSLLDIQPLELFTQPIVDLRLAKFFLSWRLRTRQGRKRQTNKLSAVTLWKDWCLIARVQVRVLGYKYPDNDMRMMHRFIYEGLLPKGASFATRPKALLTPHDVDDLIHFLICADEKEFRHPRELFETCFALILFKHGGYRTGEIFESTSHCKTDEGLKYGHVKFPLVWRQNALQPCVDFDLLYRKGHRKKDALGYGDTSAQFKYSQTDPSEIFSCPVLWFMASAIADGALPGVQTVQDLEEIFRKQGTTLECRLAGSYSIQTREATRQTPVFRMLDAKTGAVHPSLITRSTKIIKQFREAGRRYGYRDDITPYAARRGFANEVTAHLTRPEAREAMGHRDDKVIDRYMAKYARTDIQAVVQGQDQDKVFMTYASSASFTSHRFAPKPKGSHIAELNQSDLSAADIAQHISKLERKCDKPVQRKIVLEFVRKQLFLDKRDRFFQHQDMDGCTTDDTTDESIEQPDKPYADSCNDGRLSRRRTSSYLRTWLQYDSQRLAVKDALFDQPSSWMAALKTLVAWAAPEKRSYYYPWPTLGLRPLPEKWQQRKDAGPGLRTADLKAFMRDCTKAHGELLAFCFRCGKWVTGRDAWTDHCWEHLHHLDKFCGIGTRNGLVIAALLCPICLHSRSLPPNKRYRQFVRYDQDVRKHFQAHFSSTKFREQYPQECPHPICSESLSSLDNLKDHFSRRHGIIPTCLGLKDTGMAVNTLDSTFES